MKPAALCLALPVLLCAQESLGELLGRARAERDAGRLGRALAAYEAMLAQVPEHETALLERAQVLSWMGRYPEALEGYRAFRARYPGRALLADLRLAQVHAWSGAHGDALAVLAPWEARSERQAVLDGATYRAWQGDLAGALERLETWRSGHPEDAEAALLQVRFRSWTGDLRAARRDFEALVARWPGEHAGRLGLARVRLWEGDPAGAAQELARLPEEARSAAEAQVLASQIDLNLGRSRAAVRRLEPLAEGGSVRREAADLLREEAEARGPWVELRASRTDTNEGLRSEDPLLRLRMPLAEGFGELSLGRRRVTLGPEERAATDLGLRFVHPLGSRLRATAALQRTDDLGGEAATGWSAGLQARLAPGVELGLEAGHGWLAFTPAAADLRGGVHTLEASLGWRLPDQRTRIDLGAGEGRLSAGSTRRSWMIALEHRWPLPWAEVRGGALARRFGYSESLPLGFFNPERFEYAGATGGLLVKRGRLWSADLSLRGGWQRINGGSRAFAWGYAAVVNWNPGNGRATGFLSWSQSLAGLPVVDPSDPGSYREHTLALGARLRLGRH